MTSEDLPTRPRHRTNATSWHKRPGPVRLAFWIGLVSGVVGIVGFVIQVFTASGGPPAPATASGSSTTSDSSTTAEAAPLDAPSSARLAVGTCLTSDDEPSPCDSPHAFEVFDVADTCGSDALLRYLGGTGQDDVLRPDLTIRPLTVDQQTSCAVGRPGEPLLTSNRDALLTTVGDPWRHCADELSRPVSCADRHKREVIYAQGSGSEPLNCTARADDYLGVPFAQKASELVVLSDGRQCVIEVRGQQNVLTASLRRLQSRSLPLEAQ